MQNAECKIIVSLRDDLNKSSQGFCSHVGYATVGAGYNPPTAPGHGMQII